MKLLQREKSEAYIPTASMADIAFLLIVFFMLTTTFQADKTNVSLPVTVTKRSDVPKKSAFISIPLNEEYYVLTGANIKNQEAHRIEEVESFLRHILSTNLEHPIVIKADKNVPYRRVDLLMEILKAEGARNLVLLSRQRTKDSAEGG